MNFYKHHLGDYAAATAHLSWDEDQAYTRLLRAYYHTEKPIPADLKDACRLVRASSPSQRKAVETVLGEFFKMGQDGWRQKRCDEEIGQAQEQATTNRKIAEEREARRKERFVNDSLANAEAKTASKRKRVVHEPSTPSGNESSTPTSVGREPSHKPLANSHEPEANSQKPSGELASPRTPRVSAGPDGAAPTAAVWAAYSEAYDARYGQQPVRNASVNGILAQLVARLGAEAPDVARFYVGHNKSFYVSCNHAVNALLKDAEGLRTQWATGRQVTHTQAHQADRTQATFNAFAPLLAEAAQESDHAQH